MSRPLVLKLTLMASFGLAPAAQAEVRSLQTESISIPRLDEAPSLEDFAGMKPSPELAGKMARVDGFRQWIPRDGQPVSQKTEAYLGYDADHLYVVFICFDAEPHRIRARRSRREDIFRDDRVDIFLDTFNDQLRSYAFTVNPFGIQADAYWIERDEQQYDRSFDTVWHSRGTLTKDGYVIWVAIPFKSLRFPPVRNQKWGILLSRFIPRVNEGSFWPYITSRIEGRLNQEAALEGLSELSPGRNLQLIPYGFFRSFRALDRRDEDYPRYVEDRADFDAGVDFKAVFRDSLVLDVTVNPDFNQVESDEPQVTVNQRFEVFFPEKRPFFLENSSYFETPINLFFSRRIVDPRIGARLTGKAGKFAIGVLYSDDAAEGESVAEDDPLFGRRSQNAIVRISRDLGRQSSLGIMYTDHSLSDSFNRVGGVDGRIKFSQNWVASLQVVASESRLTDGSELCGPAWDAVLQRTGRQLSYTAEYNGRSPGYWTALGFLPGSRGPSRPGRPRIRRVLLRPDIQSFRQVLHYRFRPEGDYLIAWGPDFTLNPTWNYDGSPLDSLYSIDLNSELVGQTYIGLFYTGLIERLEPEDFETLTEKTRYSSGRKGVYWNTNFSRFFGFSGEYAWGTVVNLVPPEGEIPELSNSTQGSLELTWYTTRFLKVEGAYLLSRLLGRANTQSIFNNHIFRGKVNWQFTRELSARAILQYSTLLGNPALTSLETDKNLNVDLLLTYLVNPWTALYIGYNNNQRNIVVIPNADGSELIRTSDLRNDSWQFFVKFSYFFGF